MLQLALAHRRLEARALSAEVRAAARLLASRIEDDVAVGRPHDADQLALGPDLLARDTRPLWDVARLGRRLALHLRALSLLPLGLLRLRRWRLYCSSDLKVAH